MDKYYDVLAEITQVRKDFGYPPLVTPTSQIVGTQAVMNVLFGRYKTFPNESKGLLRGEYGKLPAPVNEEVRKMAIGNDKVITCRPADLLKPEMDKYREEIRDQATCEEDVLSYALFPKVAPKFFEYRSAHQTKIDSTMLDKDNKTIAVRPEDVTVSIDGTGDFTGTVRTIMVLGHYVVVNVQHGDNVIKCFVDRDISEKLSVGQTVCMHIGKHTVFDK